MTQTLTQTRKKADKTNGGERVKAYSLSEKRPPNGDKTDGLIPGGQLGVKRPWVQVPPLGSSMKALELLGARAFLFALSRLAFPRISNTFLTSVDKLGRRQKHHPLVFVSVSSLILPFSLVFHDFLAVVGHLPGYHVTHSVGKGQGQIMGVALIQHLVEVVLGPTSSSRTFISKIGTQIMVVLLAKSPF